MNVDGIERKRLTFVSYDEEYPAWSPDGSKIAFSSARDGCWEIYVMDANGDNQRRLTYGYNYNTHPTWTPDSKKIIYESLLGEGGDEQSEIFIMDADGSHPTRLTFNARGDCMPSSSKLFRRFKDLPH